jgi:hypothetical protein
MSLARSKPKHYSELTPAGWQQRVETIRTSHKKVSLTVDFHYPIVSDTFNHPYNYLFDKINPGAMRNDASLKPFVEQAANGFAPAIRIVERQIVDPHCNEAVSRLRIHIAGKLHGIPEGVLSMIQ